MVDRANMTIGVADVCGADVTGANPKVLSEAGCEIALNKPISKGSRIKPLVLRGDVVKLAGIHRHGGLPLSRNHAVETQVVAPWIFAQGEECGA